MNLFPNIERRDSGPRHLDKTADPAIGYEAAYLDAVTRHTKAFDACDLGELVDDKMLALVKAGKALEVGQLLVQRYTQRIDHLAQWSAS
ncbi:hypothetical protein H4CHR_01555 [Variovorax sp. PBS-H4]|uniref:hypothetical protein n=1 Tax=Variovorax sp. PBS-H4 TaxID=434008 RepID=UPI0013164AC5|nr:hypothetical protein [Variovorax sp. PBS-H4]VTU25240.1 hypothetical protein H4CHR_01555 [Variovorax sp. PBS-H4]